MHNPDIVQELLVASDCLSVTVRPADATLRGGVIVIGFSVAGHAYGINHELVMGVDDWLHWRQTISAALVWRVPANDAG